MSRNRELIHYLLILCIVCIPVVGAGESDIQPGLHGLNRAVAAIARHAAICVRIFTLLPEKYRLAVK